MFAMLTGGLPFTVEPFNIKALYVKMRDGQMNPVPEGLTKGGNLNLKTNLVIQLRFQTTVACLSKSA